MKKLLGILLFLLLASSSASAAALSFDNWKFNPNGADTTAGFDTFAPIDQITLLGTALINGTTPDASGAGSFNEFGTFAATAFQNDGAIVAPATSGLGFGYELTFVMSNTSGTFEYDTGDNSSELLFTESTFEIYLDTSIDYGIAGNIAGSTDGVRIAAFTLDSGSGEVDFDEAGGAAGHLNMTFKATDLMANVWFTEDGTDMSTLPYEEILISMVDSNNDVMGSGDHAAVEPVWFNEFNTVNGLTSENWDDDKPTTENPNFFVRSDGSMSLGGVVPEPTTMILFGFGLLSIAGISRKRIR